MGEYTLEVFDSASVVPLPIRIERRDMMMVLQPDGGWEVDEGVRIHNPNSLTLVGSGATPAWEFRIPEGAEAFEVEQGEIAADQVRRMGDRVFLMFPLIPGTRVIYLRYRLPPAQEEALVSLDSPADTFNLFIRQPSPTVSVTGLTSTDMFTVEDQRFLQYSATDLPAESEVGIEWESAAPPVDPVVAAVVVTLLFLVGASIAAARGARGPVRGARAEDPARRRGLATGRWSDCPGGRQKPRPVALIRDRALVLQGFRYGDTSKILRLYCHDHGLRSVIAKGAQRPKSRFGALLEPFTEGEAQFYLKEGRDLHTLGGFDLLRSRQALGRDLTAFSGGSLIAELLLRFGTEEPHPQLYRSATSALDRIAAVSPVDVAHTALAGVWEVIALLGFHPELESCVHCTRTFEPGEAVRIDVEAGGAACTRCRPSGRVVDAASRAEVLRMCRGEPLSGPPADRGLHRALMRTFVATHLAQGHPLRSLELFVEQLG